MTHTIQDRTRLRPMPLVAMVLTLIAVAAFSDASALGIASAVNNNASGACSEMTQIAEGPWPKVFMVAGGAFAVWGIFRKERDGFQNLIWTGAFASIFAGIMGVLGAFGIGC